MKTLVFLLFGISLFHIGYPAPVIEQCPNGTLMHDSSCYYFSHLKATWAESLVYCQAYGAHLVYIQDEREQSFVSNHVKYLAGLGNNAQDHYYWLGGTDTMSEGEWYWHTIVEPITYTKWAPGKPDAGILQDCIAMYPSGVWDDGTCEQKHKFICEIELGETPGSVIG